MLRTVLLLVFISGLNSATAQESLKVAFLNSDRFFDTVNDKGEADDPYIDGGSLGWNKQLYDQRVEEVADIISGIYNKDLPSIIALAGIENNNVGKDIFGSKVLRKGEYNIVSSSYSQVSGVLLALNKNMFKMLEQKTIIPGMDPSIADVSTMLYTRLEMTGGKIIHVFVNDWPARTAGSDNRTRMLCAATLRKEIDRILNFEPKAMIIVMGCFNDEPTSGNIMTILNATNKRKNLTERDLYNPFYDSHNIEGAGTTMVNGLWQMYDYIIISRSLIKGEGSKADEFPRGGIGVSPETLGPVYEGSIYKGGSGSHLPVYLDLKFDD